MQYLTYLLPLAALAAANPLERRGGCEHNECAAAVTGKKALGDDKLRASHCASFLATTVTPVPVTVVTTVTGEGSTWADWKQKRATVEVCPNDVPNYASACDEAGYSSACSCFGFTEVKTTTVAPSTTTKTVYVAPSSCDSGKTVTVTEAVKTVTVSSDCKDQKTVTVTATATGKEHDSTSTPSPDGKCLSDEDAKKIVDNFSELLEFTSYNGTQGAPGRGYHFDTSAATLDPAFQDISDSINFMAGIPLGSVTFPNKTAFDYGQGVLQPEVQVDTLNIFHGCKDITWRWKVTPQVPPTAPAPLPVTGINYMIINDKGLIQKQYAEFDNGAWLQSFGQQCAINKPSVNPAGPALR